MPEENKRKTYEESHQEHLAQEEERKNRMEALRQETVNRLRTDPRIQDYLSHYSASSVEFFISGYATSKSQFMEYGNSSEEWGHKHHNAYFEKAQECLKQIQLKKLYHLRCEWGANLVKIEGIECSTDFFLLESDVLNCELITPISAEDFDLFVQYANTDDFNLEANLYWVGIEKLRDETESYIDIPEWFQYHNTYTGTRSFMMLPDIRGNKEDFYRRLAEKEDADLLEQKYVSGELERPVRDTRPYLSHLRREDLMDFMEFFEDNDVIRAFQNHEQYSRLLTFSEDDDDSQWKEERVEGIIAALSFMKDVRLPVEANEDWRQALIEAWDKFEKEQTIIHLPLAYEDYLFRRANNICQPKTDKHSASYAPTTRNNILRGRVLNGEPADFNF